MCTLFVSVVDLGPVALLRELCVGPEEVDEFDEEAEAEVAAAEAAFLAAIAVGERSPMPEEKYIFDMGRAYALGVESL